MAYKSIHVPPPNFEGTLADWTALNPRTQYNKCNQVKRAAYNKLWRQQNYTKQNAKIKQWKQQNPARVAGYQHKRYIKKERAFYEMFGPMGVI